MLIPLKSLEPTRRIPVMTILIILGNIAAFVYQKMFFMSHGGDLAAIYGARPYELTHFKDIYPPSPYTPYISLITYMFMHGGIVHIIGNMLFFYAFAPNLEDIMGHFRFLLFYIVCGVVSAIVYIIPNFTSTIPLVGASGAIAGVMGAHFRTLPGTRISCLLIIFRITLPAIVILLPWIVLQFYNQIYQGQSSVAWLAHIGGFIFGFLLVRKFQGNN